MNRYMAVAVLMIIPLYGIRKASEELVQGFSVRSSKTVPVSSSKMTVASSDLAAEPQFVKSAE